MHTKYYLSTYTVSPIILAKEKRIAKTKLSPDLGLSFVDVVLDQNGIILPGNQVLSWTILKEIHQDQQSCFLFENGSIQKIETFSDYTGRYYSLYPTHSSPTMLISGIPMHRIKDTDPQRDTLSKIKAARPHGRVLDTATGLGYTAIESAKSADFTITIEFDPSVLNICQQNPWSQKLFTDARIFKILGDSYDIVQGFPDRYFHTVIHDPPTMSLAGHLFSLDFYEQILRILSNRGRMFHYIGDLNSFSGKRVSRGVINRLKQAGFHRVIPEPRAFGVVAIK